MKTYYRVTLIIILAILIATVYAFSGRLQVKPELNLSLQRPSFVQAATDDSSPGTTAEVAAKLSEEAGISAYKQASGPINLDHVRGLYRTIEMETADYIIGSVPVPNYSEHFDVHVYVHTDGWILAYYLKDQVASKMVDVKAETVSTTMLETVVSIIAGAVGQSTSDLKYYDFRYPNATHILLVAEDAVGDIDFTIQLPSEYIYYGYSYNIGCNGRNDHYCDLFIDGIEQPYDYFDSYIKYGAVLASTLLVGQTHQIILDDLTDYGVLVITYRVK